MSYGRTRTLVPVTIVNGQSLSGEVQTGALRIVGIIMPAGWTAAGITFQAHLRSSGTPPTDTFGNVQDDAGNEITITTPVGDEYVAIPSTKLVALGRVKLRSGTSAAPVAQAAERILYLVLTD